MDIYVYTHTHSTDTLCERSVSTACKHTLWTYSEKIVRDAWSKRVCCQLRVTSCELRVATCEYKITEINTLAVRRPCDIMSLLLLLSIPIMMIVRSQVTTVIATLLSTASTMCILTLSLRRF